ncbi:hypothetical protein [Actinomadura sp. HBU206391]|uniref:hypothetical protein n=1 Tax=Actinomadura sp. HBU206391 TaxID=2731692 RepID=UPI00164F8CDB|nr:hypothetical protein [Actinomadura sp. HBU206391]MBC6460756.1 hypothetical protein [Actinomadura sp. HBU206391]
MPDGMPSGALDVTDVGKADALAFGMLSGAPILAAGHADDVITAWDLTTRRRITTIDGLGVVNDLAVTVDGRIAVAGDDGVTMTQIGD